MNLAIIGYGKMGRLVETLAHEYGFEVPLRLDIEDNGIAIDAERQASLLTDGVEGSWCAGHGHCNFEEQG